MVQEHPWGHPLELVLTSVVAYLAFLVARAGRTGPMNHLQIDLELDQSLELGFGPDLVVGRRHQRMNLMAEHSSSMGQQTESFDHQKSEEVDTTELVGRCLYP